MDSFSIAFTPISQSSIQSGGFSLRPGVMPSAGSIVCQEQALSSPVGNLILNWSSPETGTKTILLPDCKIERVSQHSVGMIELMILDRRWKWSYGHIDGIYNLQTGDTTWEYEKKPRELMTLCFDAMGEQGYDLSDVTTEERIYVDWRGSIPAECLAELCQMLGYIVVPTANGKFAVRKIGVGGPLPSNGTLGVQATQSQSGSVTDGNRPEKIRVCCAPVRYQVKLELEAVGKEADGTIKPLEEVSWFAALSSSVQKAANFTEWEVIVDDDDRQLAQETAFRWYRIKSILGGDGANGFNPPGYLGPDDVESVYQLLPLLPILNSTYTPVGSTFTVPERYFVEGRFYEYLDVETEQNSAANTRYPHTVTLDTERGVVRFGSPVFKIDSYEVLPADMRLVCCVQVASPTNNQLEYYGFTWDAGGLAGAGILSIDRSMLVPKVTANYGDPFDPDDATSTSNNLDEVKAEAEKFAAATLRQVVPIAQGTQQVAGFHPIQLDGVIAEVAWIWNRAMGPVTRVSAGGPYGRNAMTHRESTNRVIDRQQRRAIKHALWKAGGSGRSPVDVTR